MIRHMILAAMKRRNASRISILLVAVPALALSGCAAAGPPISVDRGDGEAVSVSAVDQKDFVEALGAGDGDAEQEPVYRYLIDPALSSGTENTAVLVSTSVLPAGSRLQLLNREGTEVDSLRLPAVPAAMETGRREHVLHPSDAAGIRGVTIIPPPDWEPPETAASDAPVASLSVSARFFGAVLTADAVRLGAGSALSVTRGSSLEWTVELPAGRMVSRASGDDATAHGRLEIDYVTDVEGDAAIDDGADAPTDGAPERWVTLDLARPATGDAATGNATSTDRRTSVSYRARLSAGSGTIAIPGPALGFVPAVVTVSSVDSGVAVRRVQWHETTARTDPRRADINAPIPADLATILSSYPRSAWRRDEFEVFSWSAYPDILVFDTADYGTQARLFRRLAFFVEKRGFRGRLLSDEELSGRHGWNAHNYRPEGLATFFTQAEAEAFGLNAEEELLRELLLANGVIRRATDGYAPGKGGILSISQSSYPLLRELLITHEAYHGVFYEEEGFRDGVREIWNGLSEAERTYWRGLLSYMTYDPADEYLMINEFQAYLMQQPLDRVRGHLRGVLAPRFANARPAQRQEIERFLAEHPDTFIRAARAVEELLGAFSPLGPGDVLLLRPADGEA